MKEREGHADLTLFFLYVLISSFTILNMLIGVLVEVVGAVSAGEKEKAMISSVAEQLAEVFSDIDVDKSGMVSKLEFDQMVRNDTVRENLQQVGIQPKHLTLLADALFSADEDDVLEGPTLNEDGEVPEEDSDESTEKKAHEISFADFLKFVIQTRPQNPASVLDISQLRRYFTKSFDRLLSLSTRRLIVESNIYKLRKTKKRLKEESMQRRQDSQALEKELADLRLEKLHRMNEAAR